MSEFSKNGEEHELSRWELTSEDWEYYLEKQRLEAEKVTAEQRLAYMKRMEAMRKFREEIGEDYPTDARF